MSYGFILMNLVSQEMSPEGRKKSGTISQYMLVYRKQKIQLLEELILSFILIFQYVLQFMSNMFVVSIRSPYLTRFIFKLYLIYLIYHGLFIEDHYLLVLLYLLLSIFATPAIIIDLVQISINHHLSNAKDSFCPQQYISMC